MTLRNHEPRAPALAVAAFAVAGIFGARLFGVPMGVAALGLLTTLVAMFVTITPVASRRRGLLLFVVPAVCVAAGGVRYCAAVDEDAPGKHFDERRRVTVSGVVLDPPIRVNGKTRLVVRGDWWWPEAGGEPMDQTVLVTVRGEEQGKPGPLVEEGMTLRLVGRIRRPPREHNPGEFSPREFYRAHGITLLMSVRSGRDIVVLDSSGGRWPMRAIVQPLRRAIVAAIDTRVGGREGEFLKGILIGERSGLTPELREAFARSGTAHVLAVSGSNVAVVCMMMMLVLEMVRAGRMLRVAFTGLGILVYVALTGAQPPVVRAAVMAWVFLLGSLAGERGHPLNALGVAAIVLLGVDPLQLFDIGFQLSFAAVLSLVLLVPPAMGALGRLPGRCRWIGILRTCALLIAVSAVATLGTLPLTAMAFGRVSIVGVIANLVVVPASAAGVVLGTVMLLASTASESLADAYAAVARVMLSGALRVVETTGGWSWAALETSGFRWVDAIPFYAALFLPALRRSGLPARLGRAALVSGVGLSLLFPGSGPAPAAPGRLRVTFLDVGQGDAALIRFPDRTNALLDAGPWYPDYDAGERVIVPFLRRERIDRLDLLLISHPHDDHLGGVAAVLERVPVGRVMESGTHGESPLWHRLQEMRSGPGAEWRNGNRGILFSAGGARIYVLAGGGRTDSAAGDAFLNNSSMVVKLVYGRVSFLFMGDAQVEVEDDLVESYGEFLRADVLKTGHHGSGTSTSARLVTQVSPRYAVVSVGWENRFNHPSPDVVERLERSGASVLRTDEEGAVIFETDGITLTRLDWREPEKTH